MSLGWQNCSRLRTPPLEFFFFSIICILMAPPVFAFFSPSKAGQRLASSLSTRHTAGWCPWRPYSLISAPVAPVPCSRGLWLGLAARSQQPTALSISAPGQQGT